WRFRMNALDPLDPFIADYVQTGNIESFYTVRDAIFDWIDFNLVKDGDNSFKWYDMSAAIRGARMAFLYRYGQQKNLLTEEQLLQLLAVLEMHVEVLGNPRLLARNNHALFQTFGLAAICAAAEVLASCERGAKYARE